MGGAFSPFRLGKDVYAAAMTAQKDVLGALDYVADSGLGARIGRHVHLAARAHFGAEQRVLLVEVVDLAA